VSGGERAIDALGVVIPVHDEAEHLPACLAALDRALTVAPRGVRAVVALVLDACTDASADIAFAWAGRGADRHVLAHDFRVVGRARAAGMDRVLAELASHRPARVWLATTDADSQVSPSWLTDQLRLAADGVEAIAGSIDVHDWSEQPPGWAERFRDLYEPAGSSDSHAHVHGANLGVRADAYLAAGGFEPLATGEDHALWNALRRARRRQVSSRRLTVVTSARRVARAPLGFSAFLAAMATPLSAAS
jgi:hypothetical protein